MGFCAFGLHHRKRRNYPERGEEQQPASNRQSSRALMAMSPCHCAPQCHVSPFWAGSWLSADGRQASAKALLWGSWGCGSSAGNPMALGPLWAGAKDHETQQKWGSAGGCTPESDAWRSSQHLKVWHFTCPKCQLFLQVTFGVTYHRFGCSTLVKQ